MRKVLDVLLTFFILSCIGVAVLLLAAHNGASYSGFFKVLDGDTLLNNGQKLRLIGIDAPESSQECEDSKGSWRCGRVSTQKLQRIVHNANNLICKGDQIDKYARPLVTCYLGDKDINALMVLGGYAVAYGAYYAEEREAKAGGVGIWQGNFMQPQKWRRIHYGSINSGDVKTFFANVWAMLSKLWS